MDIFVYKFQDETSGLLAYMKLGVVYLSLWSFFQGP